MNTRRVGIRQLRKNLKQFIEGSEAVAIGDYYRIRAIIVPVPDCEYGDAAKTKAIRAAKKLFAALTARESPKSGSLLRS